jgi:rubrerythrin
LYKTDDNLQSAFAGESQAYCRYVLFAAKADQEGFPETARLFRAAAEAEMVHMRNHYTAMDAIGSTKDNLLAAATSEHREITSVYPAFVEKAIEERNERARLSFDYALKAEKVHSRYFEKAFQAAKEGQRIGNETYFVCNVCGNLEIGIVPQKCSLCGNASDKYKEVK